MKNKRKKTIGAKLSIMFVVLALVLCLGLCAFSGFISWEKYTDFFWNKALENAKLAASYVDGDRIADYIATGEKDEYYFQLEEMLKSIKREQKITYLYIFMPGDDHFTYIMDVALDTDELWFSEMGDEYEYTELEYNYLVKDVAAKRECQQKIVLLQNAYGPGVSAWAPVFSSDGNVAAMVEVDLALSAVVDALMEFLVAAALVCCALVLAAVLALALITRKMVAAPLAKLTKNVTGFASNGKLDYPAEEIQTGDEMQTLSEAFGQMARDIDQYTQNLASVAADKERIATELSLATDIQISLLPRKFPAFPGRDDFDICALIQPAKVVGGDFYDFFLIDRNHLAVVIGGVSGKGIPAALFMVVAKTIIKNQMMTGMPVEEAMNVINSRLHESSTSNMTVRAFVGVLDTMDGSFTYVNAGQRQPLLMKKGSTYEYLAAQEMFTLAETEHASFRSSKTQLRQGDRMVFYTEGVISAKNIQGQGFGAERLRTLLNIRRNKADDLKMLVSAVCDEITAFENVDYHEEDVTVMALTYAKGDKNCAEISLDLLNDGFGKTQKFLKRQMEENGLSGQFYARMSVAVEECVTLAASRQRDSGELLVRCAVSDEGGRRKVKVSIIYDGPEGDPFDGMNQSQEDAMAFVKNSMDELIYCQLDGKNAICISKYI